MDEQRWYFRDNDGVVMGPYTPEQMGDLVRSRHIEDETPVATNDLIWSQAGELPPFPESPPTPSAPKEPVVLPTTGKGRNERVVVPVSVKTAFALLAITAVIGFIAYIYTHLNAREIVTPPRSAIYGGEARYAQKANELRSAMLVYIAGAVVQATLALFLLRGHGWARISVAVLLAASVISRFVLPGPGMVVAIALELIIILAVLSHSARAYTYQSAVLRAHHRARL